MPFKRGRYMVHSFRNICFIAALAPVQLSAETSDLTFGSVGFAHANAPTVADNDSDGTCPVNMALRIVQFETILKEPVLNGLMASSAVSDRVVRRGSDETPLRRLSSTRTSHFQNIQETSMTLTGRLSICESFGFVELVDGNLSISGQTDRFQIRYDATLDGTPQDVISAIWQRDGISQRTGAMAGGFDFQIASGELQAINVKTDQAMTGTLSTMFHVAVDFVDEPS